MARGLGTPDIDVRIAKHASMKIGFVKIIVKVLPIIAFGAELWALFFPEKSQVNVNSLGLWKAALHCPLQVAIHTAFLFK